MPNQLIDIEALPPAPMPTFYVLPQTGAQGLFAFDLLPMGQYLIGVNLIVPPAARSCQGHRSRHARAYFPGTPLRSFAQPAVLKHALPVEDLVFKIPPPPGPATFSGIALLPHLTPVAALVALIDPEYTRPSSQVDATHAAPTGAFTPTGAQARTCSLFAHYERDGVAYHSDPINLPPSPAHSLRLVLTHQTPAAACTPCDTFGARISPLWKSPRVESAW